ncbi:MAG TPA: GNAT family N-acetyltransferase [Cellvibrionaceae bacterium]
MHVKFATVENSVELSEIVLAASEELRGVDFTEEGWDRFVAANTSTEFEKKLGSADFCIFCCIESNRLLGFISLKDQEKIDQLFVIPEERNRGVASFLWQFAKKNAMQKGASGTFWVRSSSVAIPVYKKFGFIPEGERQSFAGISFQLMRLQAK